MKSRKLLSIIGLILAVILLLSASFVLGRNSRQLSEKSAVPGTTVSADNDASLLGITFTKVSSGQTQTFSPEEIGNNFTQSLTYKGVSDVDISINGSAKKLEDALKYGDVTEEEIFYRARQDARKGRCEETFESEHGVSYFTYRYPDFNLQLVYDVFESPDGKDYLISDMLIYRSSDDNIISHSSNFTDPETGRLLNIEDWGLTFELVNVTNHGVVVACEQSGGQQIGQLKVFAYSIYPDNRENLDDGKAPDYESEIAMNSSCQFTIDWSESYGTLPSGDYSLYLWVSDIYDETQLHPLMENFRDWQLFCLGFTIP